MPNDQARATTPEDLGRMFVERANAGDIDGLVALYEPRAVLALPDGRRATGAEEIREIYTMLLEDRPQFVAGEQRTALHNGNLALTSTRRGRGATAEVARRQPDGTWLWMLDEPNVLG
jgi:ketosteroid isomerase-like protein